MVLDEHFDITKRAKQEDSNLLVLTFHYYFFIDGDIGGILMWF